jgi:hypothetical protein
MNPNLEITDLDPSGVNQGNTVLALGTSQWPEREGALPPGE